MFKKIFTFTTLLLTGLFSFSLQTNAATTTWTNFNFYSTFYGFVSPCILLDSNIEVLTVSVPENTYFLYNTGGIDSSINFYSNSNCTGSNREIDFDEVDPFGSINKTYFFDYSDTAFVVRSMSIRMMHSFQNITPSGFNLYITDNYEFNQEAPYTVIAYDGFTEYSREFYAVSVPYPGDPTRTGFVFNYWKDRNGDIYDFQLTPNESQLQLDLNGNQIFYLYASFSESIEIDLSDFDFFPPILPSDRPIDIILFNTGFYNDAGFVFLYALFIIGSSVLLWFLKVPTLVNVIDDIVITALFMIAGYLPLYVAIIMIMLFIVMIISINKSGGLLNE
jgi:hypothetical protein